MTKASSPSSTGPSGSHFEGQVGASYLLSMLVGAEPRGRPGTTINKIALQRAPEDDEAVWLLLRRMHILVFDFTATGSASEELARERTARALHADDVGRAGNLWSELVELSIAVAKSGGDRTPEALKEELGQKGF